MGIGREQLKWHLSFWGAGLRSFQTIWHVRQIFAKKLAKPIGYESIYDGVTMAGDQSRVIPAVIAVCRVRRCLSPAMRGQIGRGFTGSGYAVFRFRHAGLKLQISDADPKSDSQRAGFEPQCSASTAAALPPSSLFRYRSIVSRNTFPYFAALYSPTPETCKNSSIVRGAFCAISASAALEKTI